MKRMLLLLLLIATGTGAYVCAQNYAEVIYLKNGSIIKGTIIEQVPDASLKIQTPDGSLIICRMDEVCRIVKEKPDAREVRKKARSTLRGYKGEIGMGYLFALSKGGYSGENKAEFYTSHGYQFNNYFFLGAGVAADIYTAPMWCSFPFFVHAKVNFINKRIAPFADLKLGYTVGDIDGYNSNVGLGVRFALKGKQALLLKAEYHYQVYNDGDYNSYSSDGYSHYTRNDWDLENLGLKVAFEF